MATTPLRTASCLGAGEAGQQEQTGPGCRASTARCPDPETSYQGLIGERVRVVDPLGGAIHVSGLAGAPQWGDDFVMVFTAEQLGLTGVQGNTWGAQTGSECQSTPLKSCHIHFVTPTNNLSLEPLG